MAQPSPKDAANTTKVLPDTLARAFAGEQHRVASIAKRPNKAAVTNGNTLKVVNKTTVSMIPDATKVLRLSGISFSFWFNKTKSLSRVSA